MTLTDLANIGGFVNGIAVIISLIYLALQVRHAQRTQRAAMHQARVERVTNASIAFLSPEVAALIAKAGTQPTTLAPQEVVQLLYFLRIQVAALDDFAWQAEAGFLDAPSLETTVLTTKRLLANPVLRAALYLVLPQIAPELRARIERMAEETPMVGPVDWTAAWKASYAKVMAAANPSGPNPA